MTTRSALRVPDQRVAWKLQGQRESELVLSLSSSSSIT